MFEILKSVISAGGYKLADIQYKIKKLYLMGDLTEDEMTNLLSRAAGGVSTDAERPETLKLIQTLAEKITALEDRVKVLEGGNDEGNPGEGEQTKHPAWKPWDGISDQYQPDAIVVHNGKTWISNYAGQNVWEPGVVGDQFWTEYST